MALEDVTPPDFGLLFYSLVVLSVILIGVNCTVVEPIRDCAAKGVNDPRTCVHPVQSRAERFDVCAAEL